jgi:anti-sigma-K factor RskA
MSDHEEIESSLAAWVLGAMEADEVGALRTHIEACPTCRETTSRLERTVNALALDAEEINPPARLRERILAAAATSTGSAVAPARAGARTKERRRVSRTRALSVERRGVMPAVAAAAVVVLALLVGFVAGDVIGRGVPAPAPVVRSTLAGHGGLAGARATVIDLKSEGVVLVDFNGLPQLESGRVYEIWLITAGGRPDPAGVFVPDSNGSKFVLVSRSLADYTQMAVTSEEGPEGTLAPTQQPQLYGNLS